MLFLFNETISSNFFTLSLHDALPISTASFTVPAGGALTVPIAGYALAPGGALPTGLLVPRDRKSTRLNSSHMSISYAVFCLKKKHYFKFRLLQLTKSIFRILLSFYYT